jgi:hypothetical protein
MKLLNIGDIIKKNCYVYAVHNKGITVFKLLKECIIRGDNSLDCEAVYIYTTNPSNRDSVNKSLKEGVLFGFYPHNRPTKYYLLNKKEIKKYNRLAVAEVL